jgi:hypothetical protein
MSLVPNVPSETIIEIPLKTKNESPSFGLPKPSWVRFFSQLRLLAVTIQNSGTTAQRPTKNLWVGMYYFDTTLNKPIWIDKTGSTWVDATGTPV